MGDRVPLEPKYDINLETGRVVNRSSGQDIPPDEPVMLFRAQDRHLPNMLAHYFVAVTPTRGDESEYQHRLAVAKRLVQICEWQAENPLRVKTPDTVLDEGWDRVGIGGGT